MWCTDRFEVQSEVLVWYLEGKRDRESDGSLTIAENVQGEPGQARAAGGIWRKPSGRREATGKRRRPRARAKPQAARRHSLRMVPSPGTC